MAKAYLGLGANLGDPQANIQTAIEKLRNIGTVGTVSSLYKTEPVGLAEQPWFLNCAVAVDTKLSPEELLTKLKEIEEVLGRTPSERNGPRAIDIDILLYDDAVINVENLQIPHPRLRERAFALAPLAEIAPEALHPVFQKTAKELLTVLADTHGVEKIGTLEG